VNIATHYIGVDVGTGSVRAGVFDSGGVLIAQASRDIALYRDVADHAEQSSAEIWRAVCACCQAIMVKSRLEPQNIGGIGFDATCSLVVVGPDGTGLAIGGHGDADRDIIVWMDHRAGEQADRINATGHRILSYVGGTISPEMETPKLMWLKENLRATYDAATHFFDLTDFLTWKATGSLARSICTVSCKWTYLSHEQAWDASYFHQMGLGDLADDDFARIGTDIVPAGTRLANGLTTTAAAALGLIAGTPVGAGLIDAHAGGVGAIGAGGDVETNLVYVFGTSACTLAISHKPLYVPGVWGPYYSAMVPGLWLNEGGQSSAGAAIAQILSMHPAAPDARTNAKAEGTSLPDYLLSMASRAAPSFSEAAELAGSLLVVPDFLGNRAPHADPTARAIIAGLGMENDLDSLVSLYIAGLTGIGYGLRQIIAASTAAGASIETVTVGGGAGKQPLVAQLLADCTGLTVIRPSQSESVLLGAAMLGAVANGAMPDIESAVTAMSGTSDIHEPVSGRIADLHTHRFQIFEAMQTAARSLKGTYGDRNGDTQA
jgi:D-ribulokinase